MNWDDARYFLAVYRNGSLAGAARELGVSHTTVRRRLGMLEEAVETTLFVASASGLAPTDTARDAVALAQSLEEAAFAFGRRLSGRSPTLSGRLVVSTIDVLSAWMAPALAELGRRHPDIELELHTDNRFVDLDRREADVALRTSNEPSESLVGRRVGRLEFAPFAAPSLVARLGEDIGVLPWVLFVQRAGALLSEQWYREAIGERAPAVRVTNAAPMVSVIEAGVAAGLMPVSMFSDSGLVQLGPTVPELGVDVWCLTHADLRESARVRALMDCVIACASA